MTIPRCEDDFGAAPTFNVFMIIMIMIITIAITTTTTTMIMVMTTINSITVLINYNSQVW